MVIVGTTRSIEKIGLFPLNRVKKLCQTNNSFTSLPFVFEQIVKNDGSLGLFKGAKIGVIIAYFSLIIKAFVKRIVNEVLKRIPEISFIRPWKIWSFSRRICSLLTKLLVFPLIVIETRLSADFLKLNNKY